MSGTHTHTQTSYTHSRAQATCFESCYFGCNVNVLPGAVSALCGGLSAQSFYCCLFCVFFFCFVLLCFARDLLLHPVHPATTRPPNGRSFRFFGPCPGTHTLDTGRATRSEPTWAAHRAQHVICFGLVCGVEWPPALSALSAHLYACPVPARQSARPKGRQRRATARPGLGPPSNNFP